MQGVLASRSPATSRPPHLAGRTAPGRLICKRLENGQGDRRGCSAISGEHREHGPHPPLFIDEDVCMSVSCHSGPLRFSPENGERGALRLSRGMPTGIKQINTFTSSAAPTPPPREAHSFTQNTAELQASGWGLRLNKSDFPPSPFVRRLRSKCCGHSG